MKKIIIKEKGEMGENLWYSTSMADGSRSCWL